MSIVTAYYFLSAVLTLGTIYDSFIMTDGWSKRPSYRSTGVKLDGMWLKLHIFYVVNVSAGTLFVPWLIGIHKGISLGLGTIVDSLGKHAIVPSWLLKLQLFFGFEPFKGKQILGSRSSTDENGNLIMRK